MSSPSWFRGTDGCFHLLYELQLTNGCARPVTVTSVSVQDVDRGRTVEELDGVRLAESMSLMSLPAEPTTTLPGSATGVVWFDVGFRDRPGIPARISHTLTVTVPPVAPTATATAAATSVTDSGAGAAVDTRPPVELGPPLLGPGWIAVGSCYDGPHRRSIQPVNGRLRLGRRFAVDWYPADRYAADRYGNAARYRRLLGDPGADRVRVAPGVPAVAVAEATVAAAEAGGDVVLLDLGDGRFAGYAHLAPGSVRVRPGDRVRRGQVIGDLAGASGSRGPHLHFQVMDRPSLDDSDGLPFVVDAFRMTGRGPRHGELPLARDLVDFPGAGSRSG
ncbi:M23 family metallopeptidase [Kitasatospora sp. NPDC088346]|uniref:M23 family metallopeptidase n=1 Tax=Kitasatospora sp. NPDC088346 TaxID=3364073 RepID=UPI00380965D6